MLEITVVPVTVFQQNCRILRCSESGEAVVVDPGGDVDRIASALERGRSRCVEIWLTHAHLDHCGGVAALKAVSGAAVRAHRADRALRCRVEDMARMFGVEGCGMENCPEPDNYIEDGERLGFGGRIFTVLFTPGHSPGGVCFYCADEGVLISGDTLFCGSVGRTDLPGGSQEALMRSIRGKLMNLPSETAVLPGHGPDSTIGAERRANPFIVEGAF